VPCEQIRILNDGDGKAVGADDYDDSFLKKIESTMLTQVNFSRLDVPERGLVYVVKDILCNRSHMGVVEPSNSHPGLSAVVIFTRYLGLEHSLFDFLPAPVSRFHKGELFGRAHHEVQEPLNGSSRERERERE
jgi:hypothetical protein